MKHFLVQLQVEPFTYIIAKSAQGTIPGGIPIPQELENEEASWLRVVQVEGEFGELQSVVQVDEAIKAQVLAAREAQAQTQAALAQQQAARDAAKAYLNETDWYVVRFMETGREIPADVTVAREQARAAAGE